MSSVSSSRPRAGGYVSDIIRRVGDVAGPSAPVVSFLPENAVKVMVYVPEGALSSLALGQELNVRCDGCEKGLSAAVTYIAREPEFTPPVIYSLESRQTLVYLVEARAANDKPAPAAGPDCRRRSAGAPVVNEGTANVIDVIEPHQAVRRAVVVDTSR